MDETCEKWEPVEGINDGFISAEIAGEFPDLYIRLIDGRCDADTHRDLLFHFDHVAAFWLHEEFVHPTQGTVWGKPPLISEERPVTFPCLLISNSRWLADLKQELDINYEGAKQYRLCTSFPVIDIVTDRQPTVQWWSRPSSDQDSPLPRWSIHLAP